MTDESTGEKSEVEQSVSTTEPLAPQTSDHEEENPPKAWVGYLVLVGLAIYAVFLSMLALDETFDFGWFPTILEKQVQQQITLLVSNDPEQQKKASDELKDGEMFVVVPELIRKLSDSSPEVRRSVHQLLLEITPQRLNAHVIGYSPDASPENRKKSLRELWKWWELVEDDFY